MNKFLIFGVIVLLIVFGFAFKMNADTKAKQEALAQQIEQKEKEDKARENEKLLAEQNKTKQAEQNKEIAVLQSKYMMDYLDAKAILDSDKLTDNDKQFYADIGGRWADAFKVASSTSRIALAQPVKVMQDIKRELQAKQTTTFCEAKMKDELLKAYDYAIDGFLQFMQKNEVASDMFIEVSGNSQKKANTLIEYC